MRDKKENWDVLIEESAAYPEELDSMENRLQKRIGKDRRRARALSGSLSSVAMLMLFTFFVNTSTVFADSMANIPILSQLARFVRFDRSLSEAIENEYVQEVGLTAWDGERSLMIPYVIADERNLVVFYQLPEDFELAEDEIVSVTNKSMTLMDGGRMRMVEVPYASSILTSKQKDRENGYLIQRYRFSGGKLPRSLELEVELDVIPMDQVGEGETVVRQVGEGDIRKAGTFAFKLEFDEFAEPVVYEINEPYTIDGQAFTLKEVSVYPTGTEVSFEVPKSNPAWIRDLDLTIEQDGKVIRNTSGPITSTGEDGEWFKIHIDSNYFEKPREQTLVIRGIRLLPINDQFITVDLNKKVITEPIMGMELTEVVRKDGMAELTFMTEIEKNEEPYRTFAIYMNGGTVTLLDGDKVSVKDSKMKTVITVEDLPGGLVRIQRIKGSMRMLEEPIRIELPARK